MVVGTFNCTEPFIIEVISSISLQPILFLFLCYCIISKLFCYLLFILVEENIFIEEKSA